MRYLITRLHSIQLVRPTSKPPSPNSTTSYTQLDDLPSCAINIFIPQNVDFIYFEYDDYNRCVKVLVAWAVWGLCTSRTQILFCIVCLHGFQQLRSQSDFGQDCALY